VCSTHQPHNFCTQTPRAEQYFENKPEKWKKGIPFFPDIAVENGPFEDLVPNGSRKKKHPKGLRTTKPAHFGWIDLTRSFPEVGLRNHLTKKNLDNVSPAKFFVQGKFEN